MCALLNAARTCDVPSELKPQHSEQGQGTEVQTEILVPFPKQTRCNLVAELFVNDMLENIPSHKDGVLRREFFQKIGTFGIWRPQQLEPAIFSSKNSRNAEELENGGISFSSLMGSALTLYLKCLSSFPFSFFIVHQRIRF